MAGDIEITNPKEIMSVIIRKTKQKQKEFLTTLENKPFLSFNEVRDLYLDNSNDIIRQVIGVLFGEAFVELFIKKR